MKGTKWQVEECQIQLKTLLTFSVWGGKEGMRFDCKLGLPAFPPDVSSVSVVNRLY